MTSIFFTQRDEVGETFGMPHVRNGHAGAQLVEVLRDKAERSRLRFPIVSLEFFIDVILPIALWPWG